MIITKVLLAPAATSGSQSKPIGLRWPPFEGDKKSEPVGLVDGSFGRLGKRRGFHLSRLVNWSPLLCAHMIAADV